MKDPAEFAKRRRAGMEPGKASRVREHFEAQDDLYTTCQLCGAKRKGNMAELKQPHGCDL